MVIKTEESCEELARQQAECERNGHHPFHQRRRTYDGTRSAVFVECTGCGMSYESHPTREENASLRKKSYIPRGLSLRNVS